VGDAAVWLVFTLADEAAVLGAKLEAAAAEAAAAAKEAAAEAAGILRTRLNGSDATLGAESASSLLSECVDGRSGDDGWGDAEEQGAPTFLPSACCAPALSRLLVRLMDVHATLALFLDEGGFFNAADR
jgi:hypothetical protein